MNLKQSSVLESFKLLNLAKSIAYLARTYLPQYIIKVSGRYLPKILPVYDSARM